MLVASRNQVVSSSSFKLGEHNSLLSFFAYGVKFELRAPDALLSQLAWPIVPGAEFADERQADAVLTVREDLLRKARPVTRLPKTARFQAR